MAGFSEFFVCGVSFGFKVLAFLFYGTTACEKPLFLSLFVFEHFFYSSAVPIL